MKDLIRQILREEENKQIFDAASQLMELIIKGYQWVSKNRILALYNKNKGFVILYIEETINGGYRVSVNNNITDTLMNYMAMNYREVSSFITKWCYESTGLWVNDNVYEFSESEGNRMAKIIE